MRFLMSDEFDALLAETGIAFVPPAGFSPFPVREDCAFRYQRAYRHATGAEVRVRIDSLRRIRASMNGFLPANFSESAFTAGVMNLSGGQVAKSGLWDAAKAREFFRADWVRSAFFRPVDPQFAPDHDLAVVYYFHRKDIADVYLIGLYRQGTEGDRLVLGEEAPVRYPDFPQPQPDGRAAFRELWDKACKLVDGCLNLDGRPLPAPEAAERRRMAEAIPLFEQAARLEPDNAGPMLFVGKVHERLGDVAASLVSFRKAHAAAPDNAAVILELGGALGRCGLHGEAVPILSQGTARYPADPRMHCNLGLELLMSGDPQRAVMVFEQLVSLEPQGTHNKRLLALAQDVAGGRKPVPKTEQEVGALMYGAGPKPATEPKDVAEKLELAKAFLELGDPEGARPLLEEVSVGGNQTQREHAVARLSEIGPLPESASSQPTLGDLWPTLGVARATRVRSLTIAEVDQWLESGAVRCALTEWTHTQLSWLPGPERVRPLLVEPEAGFPADGYLAEEWRTDENEIILVFCHCYWPI
jgi:FimV-like protein